MPDNMVLTYQQKDAAGHWHTLSWKTGQASHPNESLHALASRLGTDSESILRLTAEHNDGGLFTSDEFGYINGVFARSTVLLPSGLTLRLR
jgi:hypothetical protein